LTLFLGDRPLEDRKWDRKLIIKQVIEFIWKGDVVTGGWALL